MRSSSKATSCFGSNFISIDYFFEVLKPCLYTFLQAIDAQDVTQRGNNDTAHKGDYGDNGITHEIWTLVEGILFPYVLISPLCQAFKVCNISIYLTLITCMAIVRLCADDTHILVLLVSSKKVFN